MLRWIVMTAAALAVVALLVIGAIERRLAESAPEPEVRLSQERMAALVAAPIARVEAGDLDGGRQRFERLLDSAEARHGARSIEAADLLMAFGAELYQSGDLGGDRRLAPLAADYVRRSIPIYRHVFGPNHPEVATALNSYADVLRLPRPDNPPAEAEAALAEAYRIRVVARGPSHIETLSTMLYLADVRGVPARTGRDPARIAAVLAELDRAVRLSRDGDSAAAARIPVAADLRRALIQARHGRADKAVRAYSAAVRRARASGDSEVCAMPARRSEELAAILETQGETERARTVKGAGAYPDAVSACP